MQAVSLPGAVNLPASKPTPGPTNPSTSAPTLQLTASTLGKNGPTLPLSPAAAGSQDALTRDQPPVHRDISHKQALAQLSGLATSDAPQQSLPAAVDLQRGAATGGLAATAPDCLALVAGLLPPKDLAAFSATSKHVHNAVKDDPALAAGKTIQTYCDKRAALDLGAWKAARTAARANRVCNHWLALPANLATLFIPSLLIKRHYAKKYDQACSASREHATSKPFHPLMGTSVPSASAVAAAKGRIHAHKLEEEIYRDLRRVGVDGDDAFFTLGSMMEQDGALGLVLATGGAYLLACTLGSIYYAAREASLNKELNDAEKEGGTYNQQARAFAVIYHDCIAAPESASERDLQIAQKCSPALKVLDRLQAERLTHPGPLKITEEETAALKIFDIELIGSFTGTNGHLNFLYEKISATIKAWNGIRGDM